MTHGTTKLTPDEAHKDENEVTAKANSSKWSTVSFKIANVGREMMLNKYYEVEGKTKTYNRHELLLINEQH